MSRVSLVSIVWVSGSQVLILETSNAVFHENARLTYLTHLTYFTYFTHLTDPTSPRSPPLTTHYTHLIILVSL